MLVRLTRNTRPSAFKPSLLALSSSVATRSILLPLLKHTAPTHRPLSTTTPRLVPQPPRYQLGPPTGLFSRLWSVVPDQAKTVLALVGGCATLMILGPLFFFVAPPLFLGGFFLTRRWLNKRRKEMANRRVLLENSSLEFSGTPEQLQGFVLDRVSYAVQTNEDGITDALSLNSGARLSLTSAGMSIDLDLNSVSGIRGDPLVNAVSVVSYGLLDSSNHKIANVVVSFQPLTRDLMSMRSRCVLEVVPLMPFRKTVVLNSGIGQAPSRTINIRAKRTTRY